MEQKRQRERVELIYAAAKDNAAALKSLIDLEKNMQTCS
jgi:hypothetical protein